MGFDWQIGCKILYVMIPLVGLTTVIVFGQVVSILFPNCFRRFMRVRGTENTRRNANQITCRVCTRAERNNLTVPGHLRMDTSVV